MKRVVTMLVVGALGMGLVGCSSGDEVQVKAAAKEEKYLGQEIENRVIFPQSVAGFVGDVMPFYDDGKYNIFYLADQRDGKQGYHPWALMKTENFTGFDDKGVVINYGTDLKSQDIALGTGSVIKDKDGKYHAFYTGHNDMYEPKEAIMHAVSDDMESWEKQPEDTFIANTNYSRNDFRDPFVSYVPEEDCYQMLITTRDSSTGVIAKYISKDLKNWQDAGVFFTNDMGTDSNMECPSLVRFNGKTYLAFSDQWPSRVVHYRIYDSKSGEFIKPDQDTFDCNGFYAGRLETDGNRLFVVGWNGTKKNHSDSEEYDWGGNMVAHELKQNDAGELFPVINSDVENLFVNQIPYVPEKQSDSIEENEGTYITSGDKYEVATFKRILGSYLIKTTIKDFDKDGMFGFAFDLDRENVGNLNIVFNTKENKIEFYNTDNIVGESPESEIDFDFANTNSIDVKMLIADGVVCMYVNDKIAFTSRMYFSQGKDWGIFSINTKMNFSDLKIYK